MKHCWFTASALALTMVNSLRLGSKFVVPHCGEGVCENAEKAAEQARKAIVGLMIFMIFSFEI